MTDVERVVDKVRKLHAHAESAAKIGNEAEAQAFAAKVQELLDHYKLSMSSIDWEKRDENDPIKMHMIDWTKYGRKVKRARIAWLESLADIVAAAYHCKIAVTPGTNYITLVGRGSDREVAEYMIAFLASALDRISLEEYGKAYDAAAAEGFPERARGFRDSFRQGFVRRLRERFDETLRREKQTATSTAIVRVTNALAEVDAWMKDSKDFGTAPGVRGSSDFNREGFNRGKQRADEMNLNRPLSGGSERRNGLLSK